MSLILGSDRIFSGFIQTESNLSIVYDPFYQRPNPPRWQNTLHTHNLGKWVEIRELTLIVTAHMFCIQYMIFVMLWKQQAFLISPGIQNI